MRAWLGGAIPVYWGSGGMVHSLFNGAAFVHCGDFPSLHACASFVHALAQDEARMEAMRSAPVFASQPDGGLPDIFRGADSKLFQQMAELLRRANLLNRTWQD